MISITFHNFHNINTVEASEKVSNMLNRNHTLKHDEDAIQISYPDGCLR